MADAVSRTIRGTGRMTSEDKKEEVPPAAAQPKKGLESTNTAHRKGGLFIFQNNVK